MSTTTDNPPEGVPPERPEPDSFGSPPQGGPREPRVAQLPALVALGSLAVGALIAVRELARRR